MPYILDSWCSPADGDEHMHFRPGQILQVYLYDEFQLKKCDGIFVIGRVKDFPLVQGGCLGCNYDEYDKYYRNAGQEGAASHKFSLHFCEGDVRNCDYEEWEDDQEFVHVDAYRVLSNTTVKELLTEWKCPMPDPRILKLASKVNHEMKARYGDESEKPRPKAQPKRAAKKNRDEGDEEKDEESQPSVRRTSRHGGALVITEPVEPTKKGPKNQQGEKGLSPGKAKKKLDAASPGREPGSRDTSALDAELNQLRKNLSSGRDQLEADEDSLRARLKPKKQKRTAPPAEEEEEADADDVARLKKLLEEKREADAPSPSKRLKAASLLADRAKAHAGTRKPAAAADEEVAGSELGKLLRLAMKRRSDDDSDDDLEPTESSLDSKRMLYRKLAKSKPGTLLLRALNNMREQVTSITGEDDSDNLAPICLRFYLSVFLPNNRHLEEPVLREIRTLCESIDGLLKGKTMEVLDLLSMRLKASMMASQDGHWNIAKHLELLPASSKNLPIPQEEEDLIRRIESGELKAKEIVAKLKKANESC